MIMAVPGLIWLEGLSVVPAKSRDWQHIGSSVADMQEMCVCVRSLCTCLGEP